MEIDTIPQGRPLDEIRDEAYIHTCYMKGINPNTGYLDETLKPGFPRTYERVNGELIQIHPKREVKLMGRLDTKPEDWKKATEAGEEAADLGSIFIQKRMPNDRNKIYVVFLEIPKFGTIVYPDGKSAVKGQANVLSYGKDGSECEEGVFILEMAPKHHNGFMVWLEKPKYGLAKLYEIERRGVANYQQTIYVIDDVRDLTPEEIEHAEKVELHELFSRRDDSTTTTSPPPVSATGAKDFIKQCVEQGIRLGWAEDEDTLKTNLVIANKTFFQGFIKSKDMTRNEQQRFLEGLKAMEQGQGPSQIVDVTADALNLDEDVDFF